MRGPSPQRKLLKLQRDATIASAELVQVQREASSAIDRGDHSSWREAMMIATIRLTMAEAAAHNAVEYSSRRRSRLAVPTPMERSIGLCHDDVAASAAASASVPASAVAEPAAAEPAASAELLEYIHRACEACAAIGDRRGGVSILQVKAYFVANFGVPAKRGLLLKALRCGVESGALSMHIERTRLYTVGPNGKVLLAAAMLTAKAKATPQKKKKKQKQKQKQGKGKFERLG